MSSYIDVRDPSRETLAEMHVIELLQDLVRNTQDALIELSNLVTMYLKGNLEVVKNRYEKIRGFKGSAENAKSKVLEYVVRVSPSMINKEVYASIASALERVAQLASGIAHRLAIMSSQGLKPKPDIIDDVNLFVEKFMEEFDHFRSSLMMLNVNARRTIEESRKVKALEEEIDEIYRLLKFKLFKVENLNDLIYVMLFKEVTDLIEDSADLIKEASENLAYIALHKVA